MINVLLFLAEGFEEIEAVTVVDVLRRANIKCDTCSISDSYAVTGAHKIEVKSDVLLKKTDLHEYGAIVLPGGMPGAANLRDNHKVVKIVSDFYKKGKIVSAICAAPIVLEKAQVVKGIKVTSYPGVKEELEESIYLEELFVEDKNLITSRGPATAIYFALKLVERIKYKEVADEIKCGMLLDFVEGKIKDKCEVASDNSQVASDEKN